ncbi:MAG: histidine phosphatase family protein [Betaproteobacteria bacterium]|nr:histidine phosphatase family protein [Betaproteobacteria bacterium]
MQLILWRHAEAEEFAANDLARALTPRGQRQAAKMSEWLHSQLGDALKEWRVIASPALRAQQTARALGVPIETVDAIAPDAEPDAIIDAAQWPDAARNTVVTGHQPTLGRVAARLLQGNDGQVSVKKGAMWWFEVRERDGRSEVRLKTMVVPEHV